MFYLKALSLFKCIITERTRYGEIYVFVLKNSIRVRVRRPLEETRSFSKTFIPFSIHGSFQNIQLSIQYGLMDLHTTRDALELNANNSWKLLLFRRTWHPWSPTRMSDLDWSDYWSLPSLKQSILNESWSTGHNGSSGPCSDMTSFFMVELQLVFADGTVDCVSWQWFLALISNKGLGPCPWHTEMSPLSLNL